METVKSDVAWPGVSLAVKFSVKDQFKCDRQEKMREEREYFVWIPSTGNHNKRIDPRVRNKRSSSPC